ncbi:MAG: hypothetical protein AAB483_01050 [Patescibacteria group bacterium]
MDMRGDEDELKYQVIYGHANSPNYYGDIVRGLFVAADVIILLALPFFYPRLHVPVIVPVTGVIISGLAAGLTSARFKWTLGANTLISVVALALLEYCALMNYRSPSMSTVYLFLNQVLVLLYFFALYYSVQTLRKWMK